MVDGLLEPGGYAIVCDEDDQPVFEAFGLIMRVMNMPAIVNTGATLVLDVSHWKSHSFRFFH